MANPFASLCQDPQTDPRRLKILDGAMTVFLAYGFQRTTMDDIARAAEISRPGLYLQFRNKQDIYRALAERFVERVLAAAAAILAGDGPLTERLAQTVQTFMGIVAEIEQAPHGADMLDMQTSLAGDIVARARTRMLALIEAAVARDVGGKQSSEATNPSIIAGLLLDALDGMKARRPPRQEQMAVADCYVRLIAGLIARP